MNQTYWQHMERNREGFSSIIVMKRWEPFAYWNISLLSAESYSVLGQFEEDFGSDFQIPYCRTNYLQRYNHGFSKHSRRIAVPERARIARGPQFHGAGKCGSALGSVWLAVAVEEAVAGCELWKNWKPFGWISCEFVGLVRNDCSAPELLRDSLYGK